MRTLHLKLILLFRSIPNNDIEIRELLKKAGFIERFTPYVAGGRRGLLRSDEAREATKRGDRRSNFGGRDNRDAGGDSCRSAQIAGTEWCSEPAEPALS